MQRTAAFADQPRRRGGRGIGRAGFAAAAAAVVPVAAAAPDAAPLPFPAAENVASGALGLLASSRATPDRPLARAIQGSSNARPEGGGPPGSMSAVVVVEDEPPRVFPPPPPLPRRSTLSSDPSARATSSVLPSLVPSTRAASPRLPPSASEGATRRTTFPVSASNTAAPRPSATRSLPARRQTDQPQSRRWTTPTH